MSLSRTLSDTNKNLFVNAYVDAMLFSMHDQHPSEPDTMVPFEECLMDDYSIRKAKQIAERVLNEILNTMETAFLRNINTGWFNWTIDWSQLGYDAALEYDIACTSAFDEFEKQLDGPYVQCIKEMLTGYIWTFDRWVSNYWIEECDNGCDGQLRAVIA